MRDIKNPTPPIVIILLAGVLIAALAGVFNASPVSQGAPAPQNPAAAQAALGTINQYCVGCHNDRAKTGGVSFQGLTADTIGQHGRIKGGQHLKYPQDSRFADLLLTLFERNDIPVKSIGDSGGILSEV